MPERDEGTMTAIWQQRRDELSERDRLGARVRDVLANRLDVTFRDVVGPEEEPVVANLLWAGVRTVAQRVASGFQYACRPRARTNAETAKRTAERHEEQLQADAEEIELDATNGQMAYWLVSHDHAPLVVRPSPKMGMPIVEVRDPLTSYPGEMWPYMPALADCLFATEQTVWQAAQRYPDVLSIASEAGTADKRTYATVTVGEMWDEDGVTIALLEPRVKVLAYHEHIVPGPHVFAARGFSPDLGFHGQFDHSVPAMIAQAKLFAMMMAYAEQQVSAETVVVGDIVSNQGQWATGPGAVNQLANLPGSGANKLTNNMSIQVFQEIDRLERFIRIGGNFPAQLSGEPVATVATGRGVEQLVASVDDNVSYWQRVARRQLRGALEHYGHLARAMGSDGADNYNPEKVRVDVRFAAGVDPSFTVRQLQLLGAKLLSREDVMSDMPEIDDVQKAMARVDSDDLRQALMSAILVQVNSGAMPPEIISEIIKQRNKGVSLEQAYEDVIGAPAAEAGQEQAPSLADLLGGGPPAGGPMGPAPALPQGAEAAL